MSFVEECESDYTIESSNGKSTNVSTPILADKCLE